MFVKCGMQLSLLFSLLVYLDDTVAIMMAFQTPHLEILGLTTIFGNVTTEDATRNALLLVNIPLPVNSSNHKLLLLLRIKFRLNHVRDQKNV